MSFEVTFSYPIEEEVPKPKPKPKKENKIRYYFFCIRWLWHNRDWENTRQKFKAMERAYRKGGEADA